MIYVDDKDRDCLLAAAQLCRTPERVFTDPNIKVWRKLEDRENCIWDFSPKLRLHVKRFPASVRHLHAAEDEINGLKLLHQHKIPHPELLVSHHVLKDGRSYVVTVDLAGFTPADKLIESGFSFDRLLHPTAALAAKLHNSGLHHRDLYLCHFFARAGNEGKVDMALIDAARVRELPRWPLRQRWIVKDLAQFWYSMTVLPISDDQRKAWLAAYAFERKIADPSALQRSIISKSRVIAAHDVNLRRQQPGRNISIPTASDSKYI